MPSVTAACVALTRWGDARSVDFLTALVSDPAQRNWGEPADALVEMGADTRALAAIVSRLKSDPHRVGQALRQAGRAAEPPLLAIVRQEPGDPQTQVIACRLLAELGGPDSLPILLRHPDDAIKIATGVKLVLRQLLRFKSKHRALQPASGAIGHAFRDHVDGVVLVQDAHRPLAGLTGSCGCSQGVLRHPELIGVYRVEFPARKQLVNQPVHCAHPIAVNEKRTAGQQAADSTQGIL